MLELWELEGFEALLVGCKCLLNKRKVFDERQWFSIDTWTIGARQYDIWVTILLNFSFL